MNRRNERGSASLEAAVGVPAFALFVALIIFGGRTATAHQALESAAADAARSASLARTAGAATEAARQAAQTSIANQDLSCTKVEVSVDTDAFTHAVGSDSAVGVTVSCLLDLSDLSIPGIPGSHVVRATMSSPLDTWRGRSS
ncbi:TadE/TadG family type IV pilus assembly protein [Nocardioides sp.]|uniref:TadE/TadG family type IV pilus assembly protein n=1 Tax=Nocardioides sp. TaxID=35761 RepID=UPI002BBFB5AB|nr:TadE/TadG family type IV pilus assembly protein [Nocardioides sp.]HXH78402.1 TadE/TadG family type IV pilus assembly protein [Nocardioides sp.]